MKQLFHWSQICNQNFLRVKSVVKGSFDGVIYFKDLYGEKAADGEVESLGRDWEERWQLDKEGETLRGREKGERARDGVTTEKDRDSERYIHRSRY